MNLVNDWQAVLAKAWTVKFNIAAALLSAAEIIVPLVSPDTVPRGAFAGVAAFISIITPIVRTMAQKELNANVTPAQ